LKKVLKRLVEVLKRDFELGFEFKKPPFFGGLFWMYEECTIG